MRGIPSVLKQRFNDPSVEIFVAVELLFDSGAIRLWTGSEDKTFGGNLFTATGSLLGVGGMEEAEDLSSTRASISLSGVDSAIISTALQEPYQNRPCKIFMGSGNEMFEIFSGFMDVMTIEDSGDTSTINVSIENRLILLDRKVPLRYTQETQQQRYPGDTFFSFVTDLADKQITWGRETAKPISNGSSTSNSGSGSGFGGGNRTGNSGSDW